MKIQLREHNGFRDWENFSAAKNIKNINCFPGLNGRKN